MFGSLVGRVGPPTWVMVGGGSVAMEWKGERMGKKRWRWGYSRGTVIVFCTECEQHDMARPIQ